MYIDFQQNRVDRSVITVHTNSFAKNLQLAIITLKKTPFGHVLPTNGHSGRF